jgi:hypothetical protein
MAQPGRITEIYSPQSANTATTETIRIDIDEDISSLFIQMKGTNNGNTATAHPATMISKIEMSIGGKTPISLSGIECQAVNMSEKAIDSNNVNIMNYMNDVMAIATYRLDFGRWIGDKMYALNPSIQNGDILLKITHNKALGGSAPDLGELGVYAQIFDKKTGAAGFIGTKEQRSIPAVSSDKSQRIILDTLYPTRNLFLQSRADDKQPWEQFNVVTVRNGSTVILNEIKTSNLLKMMAAKPIEETIFGTAASNALTAYCTPTYETGIKAEPLGATASYNATAQSTGGKFVVTSSASAPSFQIGVRGFCPHGIVPMLPLVNPIDPSSWLTPESGFNMDITHGSSVGSSTYINVLQQMLYVNGSI